MKHLISFAIHYARDRNCFNVSHNKPWQRKICRNFEPWTIFSVDTQKGEPGRMFDICILMIWWPWHTFAIFCHLLFATCEFFLLSSWVVDTAICCIFAYVQTRFAQVLCCDQWTPKVEKLRRFLQLHHIAPVFNWARHGLMEATILAFCIDIVLRDVGSAPLRSNYIQQVLLSGETLAFVSQESQEPVPFTTFLRCSAGFTCSGCEPHANRSLLYPMGSCVSIEVRRMLSTFDVMPGMSGLSMRLDERNPRHGYRRHASMGIWALLSQHTNPSTI